MELSEQIYELARKYEKYTAENLSKIVKHKSLSLNEKSVVEEIKGLMIEAGFDEVKIDGLGNIVGRIGSGKKIIAIDGHIDVVDLGNLDNWDFDPLGGEIKDGHVHGRGTVDQKGGPAAFITAGRILKEIGVPEDLTVYFVGSIMEEDCDGLCWKYIIEEENLKPDCVIVTEPTNLNIYRGHRGRMEIGVSFNGVSSHGSAPERGKNAIYMASKAALEVEKLNEKLLNDPFLGKGTIAVTEIRSSSPSLCAVSDFCYMHLDRRLTWGEDKALAVSQIEEIVKRVAEPAEAKVEVLHYDVESFTGMKYGMEKYFPTWKLEEDHPVISKGVEVYSTLFKADPKVDKWTFSTNGIAINGLHNIPVIGFGPGNEVLAHAPNEKVPVEHLVKASAFYAYFCMTF
ncbi:MAG: YgeY family selenium metabolism-linked hydrolase [Calditrichaeota bacterium]|nr:MAG: YgeY family selenium metabolism-linked hydrolase [Calditrichota bacterium]MBL1204726.1 YgeY family selenium metabolism-linked hydrolase [Calditrichota bacterium]NOG44554.1 YgeY family selenium metabolism-linked hydrolase [Calditrichota bacterium]